MLVFLTIDTFGGNCFPERNGFQPTAKNGQAYQMEH